ncbi:MAG: WYL domain-containing protein [Spirochaetota bacterium]
MQSAKGKHKHNPIEIYAILGMQDTYTSAAKLSELYSQLHPDTPEPISEKTIQRYLDKKLPDYLPADLIEKRKGTNGGYRIRGKYKTELNWMLPLFSRYLAEAEPDALNYIFESLTFQLQARSLYNLTLLQYAREHRHPIRFIYIKYGTNEKKHKTGQVIAIRYAGRKLTVHIREDATIKKFFFTGIDAIEVEYESQLPEIDTAEIDAAYRDSLGGYIGGETQEVRLRFETDFKTRVQKEFFHHSQKIEESPDGQITMTLNINKDTELIETISNFLPYVEILEPKQWREKYVQYLQKALDLHKKTE